MGNPQLALWHSFSNEAPGDFGVSAKMQMQMKYGEQPPECRGEAWLDVWSTPIWDAHLIDLPY